MMTSLKRVIKSGLKGFLRNTGLTVATLFIMLMVIFLISSLYLFNQAADILISSIQDKVDISVYFKDTTSSQDIIEFKSELDNMEEVKNVEYVTKEDALASFTERHKDDPVLMESLAELGANPFLASLNIRASQASQYEQINSFLEDSSLASSIEKIDYYRRKPVIDKLFSLTSSLNKGGLVFSLVLGVIAVLVAFNTIRIAIYNSKEEISVMRLVGASNWFIRGPFVIQGIISGLAAVVIALILSLVLSYFLDSTIREIAPDISIFRLFVGNFWVLLLIQLLVGIGLGALSSLIAVRKYLKI